MTAHAKLRQVITAYLNTTEGARALEWIHTDGDLTDYAIILNALSQSFGGLFDSLGDPVDDLPLTDAEFSDALTLCGDLNDEQLRRLTELRNSGGRSDGVLTLLSIARVAMNIASTNADRRVVMLDTSSLDEIATSIGRRLIGGAATRMLATDTAVAIVEAGRWDPDRMLSLEPEKLASRITSRITREGFQSMSRRSHDEDLLGRLVRDWVDRERPLVLMLGAGFSYSSDGLPLGNDMRDMALEELYPHREPHDRAQRLIDEILGAGGPRQIGLDEEGRLTEEGLTLERVWLAAQDKNVDLDDVISWFSGCNDTALTNPGRCVMELGRLLEIARDRGLPLIVLTVNFDTLLEPAFEDLGLTDNVFVAGRDLHEAPNLVARICTEGEALQCYIKLHGTIADPDTMVTSVRQTLEPDQTVFGEIAETLNDARLPIVHVGHSLRDLDLRPDLIRLKELVLRFVGPDVPELSVKALMRARDEGVSTDELRNSEVASSINTTADSFFAALRRLVEEAL